MLRVNEEKLLHDHKELVDKKDKSVAKIEADTKAFAATLGYDETKTKDLVAFVIGKDNGLTAEENAKLEILSAYIDEVEEPAVEIAESAEVAAETDPVLRVGVVNNI